MQGGTHDLDNRMSIYIVDPPDRTATWGHAQLGITGLTLLHDKLSGYKWVVMIYSCCLNTRSDAHVSGVKSHVRSPVPRRGLTGNRMPRHSAGSLFLCCWLASAVPTLMLDHQNPRHSLPLLGLPTPGSPTILVSNMILAIQTRRWHTNVVAGNQILPFQYSARIP